MIIDHAHGLHEGIADRGAHKGESVRSQVTRHGIGFGARGTKVGEGLGRRSLQGPPSREAPQISVEGGELKADPPNQLETRWSFRKGTQNKRRSESLLLGKRDHPFPLFSWAIERFNRMADKHPISLKVVGIISSKNRTVRIKFDPPISTHGQMAVYHLWRYFF